MSLLSSLFVRDLRRGPVDPDLVGWRGGDGASAGEAFGVSGEGGVVDDAAPLQRLRREPVVHVMRRAEAERAMVVLVVVPVEEGAAVTASLLDMVEAVGEAGV